IVVTLYFADLLHRHFPATARRAADRAPPRAGRERLPQCALYRVVDHAYHFRAVAPVVARFRSRNGAIPVRRAQALARSDQLPYGHRRHLHAVRAVDHVPAATLHSCELGRHYATREGIYDRLPRARDLNAGRVPLARSRAVLSLLRGRADPDVPHHRRVGRPPP